MDFEQVNELIESVGFPCAYYAFPENQEKPLAPPFICFYFDSSNDFYADNKNFASLEHLIVELYTRSKDFEAEYAVETTLEKAGLTWQRQETDIPDEKLYEVIFETDVMITKTKE